MEPVKGHRVLSKLSKAVRIVADIILLLAIALVEDVYLWHVPKFVHERQSRMFPSRCTELKAGMNQDQVMEIIHRGMTPSYEGRAQQTRGTTEDLLDFESPDGSCTVQLDSATHAVIGAKFRRFEGGVLH